MKILKII